MNAASFGFTDSDDFIDDILKYCDGVKYLETKKQQQQNNINNAVGYQTDYGCDMDKKGEF